MLLVATDLGVDVVCAAEDADRVRGALDVPEVPEAAAEVLRVESGRPRYGVDLDDATIPQEAGLNERAVSFTKGCYVGQETVARLHYRGKPNRHLRGLRLSAPVPTGTPLLLGEREVGRVGSSVVSPRLGPIALALVRREAAVGDELVAGDGARGRRRAAVLSRATSACTRRPGHRREGALAACRRERRPARRRGDAQRLSGLSSAQADNSRRSVHAQRAAARQRQRPRHGRRGLPPLDAAAPQRCRAAMRGRRDPPAQRTSLTPRPGAR